ncbi:MAG: putative cytokinetic ring protein SteA, partial [Acidimicrobiia bacterium]
MAIEQYSDPEFEIDPVEIVAGPARADRRTKELVKRLCPGDIAVIDHADIDRVAAENLTRCAPSAVINASTSFTGRYPHMGPLLIAEAGIPLIDDVGSE